MKILYLDAELYLVQRCPFGETTLETGSCLFFGEYWKIRSQHDVPSGKRLHNYGKSPF